MEDPHHSRTDEYVWRTRYYLTHQNPLEIIPLQTTRKENNWKTEETLARTAVTLERERIKRSNS
jgi:hypothetical protein